MDFRGNLGHRHGHRPLLLQGTDSDMALRGSSTAWDITMTSSGNTGYSHYKADSLHLPVSSSISPHSTYTMLHIWWGPGGDLCTASPKVKHFIGAS